MMMEEMERWKEDHDQSIGLIQILQMSLSSLQKEKTELEELLSLRERQIGQLKDRAVFLKGAWEDKEEEIKVLIRKVDSLRKEVEDVQKVNRELEGRIKDLGGGELRGEGIGGKDQGLLFKREIGDGGKGGREERGGSPLEVQKKSSEVKEAIKVDVQMSKEGKEDLKKGESGPSSSLAIHSPTGIPKATEPSSSEKKNITPTPTGTVKPAESSASEKMTKTRLLIGFSGIREKTKFDTKFQADVINRIMKVPGAEVYQMDATNDKEKKTHVNLDLTHLLSPTSEKTLRFLAAILNGNWIITDVEGWLQSSLEGKHWTDESSFGFRIQNNPFKGKKMFLGPCFLQRCDDENHAERARLMYVKILFVKCSKGILVQDPKGADFIMVGKLSKFEDKRLYPGKHVIDWYSFTSMITASCPS